MSTRERDTAHAAASLPSQTMTFGFGAGLASADMSRRLGHHGNRALRALLRAHPAARAAAGDVPGSSGLGPGASRYLSRPIFAKLKKGFACFLPPPPCFRCGA